MATHVTITLTDESGRSSSARVLSFDTELTVKETLQSLTVIATILKHYHQPTQLPKDKPTNV